MLFFRCLTSNRRTWVLTSEPVMEPPALLKTACAEAGLEDGQFVVCDLGETRLF